ncbi:MAG TPA: FecR domain-containing protein, partial [Vicinamibacteria bacterium]|nr:FecR domain-containing protein [Vicinamibacteria bacterium]
RPPGPTPTGPAAPVLVLERVTGGGMAAPPLRTGQGLPIGSWLETAENGRAAWRMRGASVRQDRGTLVRLLGPAALWLERGALYVDGAGGAAAIEIRTAQGRILEVGTQFEVRASTPRLSVRVREGSVVLVRGQERHEVAAGRGLEADARTVAQRVVASHGPGWSWVEEVAPEFPLEGRTLRSFLAWTARETGWRIRFARSGDAERAASITLHGSGAGLAPRDALATVLPSCGFVWRREGGTVWIEPAGEAR